MWKRPTDLALILSLLLIVIVVVSLLVAGGKIDIHLPTLDQLIRVF